MPSDNNLKAKTTPTKSGLPIFLILVTFLAMSCKECPTEPENHNNNPPDTTSHNFVWEIYTFGDLGSSEFNDVWIVGENNIWIVGEIFINDPDSSFNGAGWETFNAARWDGEKWNLSRFDRGAELNSIWYFSENDIWASGGVPIHWDGEKWSFYHLWDMGVLDNDDGGVDHIWASSPSNIYFVGRKGSIVHYDGSKFRKIESGTTLSINDIWGAYNNKTRQWEIMAVAHNLFTSIERKVIKICDNKVVAVCDSGLPISISSIFFIPGEKYYVVGDGVYETDKIDDTAQLCIWSHVEATRFYSSKIRGNSENDIFVVGHYGEIVHFNGKSWRSYNILDMPMVFKSIAVKGNLVVCVGMDGRKAYAAIGRRG